MLDCTIALLDYNLLPGAGGLLDQDAALWEDIKLCIALISDAQQEHGGQRQDFLAELTTGDPLEKGGARMDLWGA